jgi:AcrR family transcriptional regulator
VIVAGEDGEVTPKRERSDRARTRDLLLDVMGRLLEEKGLDFSLPDLARESGVATATVYRHFDNLGDLREEFYRRHVTGLVESMRDLAEHHRGRRLVHEICRAWGVSCLRWARAATYIRSAEGFAERLARDDEFVSGLYDQVLHPAIQGLIDDGIIPDQDPGYAALMWITLFDERVIIDLTTVLGMPIERATDSLERSLLGSLGASI